MKRKLLPVLILIFTTCIFFGCKKHPKDQPQQNAQQQGGGASQAPKSNVARIIVTTLNGESSPIIKPGEDVFLIARGYDKNNKEIPFIPGWAVDKGTITNCANYIFPVKTDATEIKVFAAADNGVTGDIIIKRKAGK